MQEYISCSWSQIYIKVLITAQLCLLQYFRFTLRQNVISNCKCYVRFQPTYLFLQLHVSLLGDWFTLVRLRVKLKHNCKTTELLCTVRKLWNKILCHRKERYIWQYLSAYVNWSKTTKSFWKAFGCLLVRHQSFEHSIYHGVCFFTGQWNNPVFWFCSLCNVTLFIFKKVLAASVSHTKVNKNNSFTVVRKASTLNLKQSSSYHEHLKD